MPLDFSGLAPGTTAAPSGNGAAPSLDFAGLAPAQPAGSPTSTEGAFARGAVRGAVPAVAGMAGFGAGAEAGAAVGALGGPAAPITVPVGGLLGGLVGAYLAARGAGAAQEAGLKALPDAAKAWLGQSDEQRAADLAAHPYAAEIGELAPQLALMRPGAIAKDVPETATAMQRLLANPLTARAAGAAAAGGQEAAQEKIAGEPIDPESVAIAAGAGALMNKETALGERATGFGAARVRSTLDFAGLAPHAVEPAPKIDPSPILSAGNVDDAIGAAQALADEPAHETPTEEIAEAPDERPAPKPAGIIAATPDGYAYRTHDADGTEQETPLVPWDENEAAAPGTATISPDLAAAQREHYASLGLNVVYFHDDPAIPFDGAVSPDHPDTLFLSNDPSRNAAQIGAHELTHALESTDLPDGTNLGDMLHEQVQAGLTEEGLAHAEALFGQTAPDRALFPEGPDGEEAHSRAVTAHLVRELSADIGGEAPAFPDFMPKVMDAVESRWGASVAKDVLQRFMAHVSAAMDTVRSFFGRDDDPLARTQSQDWVTNLGDVHDTLAKMYAERYGTQLEKEQARVAAMKRPEAPAGEAAPLTPAPAPETPGARIAAPSELEALDPATGGKPQEGAEELPLFGGKRQGTLFSPKISTVLRQKAANAFSPKREEPFYSALTRGVEQVKLDRAPPGQWEATIRNMPGVKSEEREWSGIDDWLRQQPRAVTKTEVLGYIKAHEIQLNEVMHVARDVNVPIESKAPPDTKFSGYTLPGGKNYREMLLTLPSREPATKTPMRNYASFGEERGMTPEEVSATWRTQDPRYLAWRTEQDQASKDALGPDKYRSPHWDEPNVLAHIRFDDRTDADGKRDLHVAEIQSDWHQKGRKGAYRASQAEQEAMKARLDAITAEKQALATDRDPVTNVMRNEAKWHELSREQEAITDDYNKRVNDAVPDAPFKTTWPELAMKRMIRYAAEHGYDRITWDTGETNAARYDLSKHLKSIHLDDNASGGIGRPKMDGPFDHGRIRAFDHAGKQVVSQHVYDSKELADLIGKEAAERLLAAEPKESTSAGIGVRRRRLDGLDLKVGGEGMRAFYDKQLPLIANKLGKKFGAKVGETILPGADEQPAQWLPDENQMEPPGRPTGEGVKAHSIDITPPMRESVMQGQPLFSPRIPREGAAPERPEDILYRDQISDLIAATTDEPGQQGAHPAQGKMGRGGGEGPTMAERAARVAAAGVKQIKNLNILESGGESGYIGTLFPRTLATLDTMSARFWNAWQARDLAAKVAQDRLRRIVAPSLVPLAAASRDHVYAALELARKFNWRPPDDGRVIRVKNTSYWQAQKSKPGDNYLLSKDETRAFHDLLNLGDEGWRSIMRGLAEREGWNGPLDSAAIRDAAKDAGAKLPEGKRLLRLAAAIDAAQQQVKRPYFPAARFGDYFLAVRPKRGTDTESLGGYPAVEWFETVEKPKLDDMIGRGRQSADEMLAVQEAVARIRAMRKTDGSLAFPEETHDIETGDLKTRPDILRSLNIPAVEKLFMLMERNVTKGITDSIIAEGPEEPGVRTGTAEGRAARAEANARYEALLGQTKDALLDAVYQDLLAGFKRKASLVPGYSADFGRAIANHIGHVGRNAADLAHRDGIERAYQTIQDDHPHASVKSYWQRWRQYQESQFNPWRAAFAGLAHYGAAYAMALNPSTTIMIAAHTPMMAAPVLGVGGNMGQAVAQMLRGLREAYAAASFNRQRGAVIDATRLGKTPREKVLIAQLEAEGLTHSLGADDVSSIADRQSALFGDAAPVMRRAMDMAMSNVSVVDRANRLAIALAAFRMASNSATLEKMARPWLEHNAVFRDKVESGAMTPEDFARFMLDEAAGSWGKMNQAPAMRGVEGSLLFTLHGFQTRYLSTAWKLMKNMGPEGRIAGTWMMAGLALSAGVMGLPFAQDLESAGEALWRSITGVDPMIDYHVRKFLGDTGFSELGTEAILRGPLSVLLGTDLGNRIGFGDIIGRIGMSDAMGTVPAMIWERLGAAWNRERAGQGAEAALSELLPAALRHPAEAAAEASTGLLSQYGRASLPAGKLSALDITRTALGLPPLSETQAFARHDFESRLRDRYADLHDRTLAGAAFLNFQAQQAEKGGDSGEAQALYDRSSRMIGAYNQRYWQAPVTGSELGNAILQLSNPDIYQFTKLPAAVRGEATRSPYP